MKPTHRTLIARLCAAVLALLGFASCDYIIDGPVEYGCPNMDYKISGTVTDEAGAAIEGIRVVIPNVDYDYDRNCYVGDTLFTDRKGYYVSPQHNDMSPAHDGMLFEDVDGEKNGKFLSLTLTPEQVRNAPNKQVKKGDGHWYDGGFEYTVDVKLSSPKKD